MVDLSRAPSFIHEVTQQHERMEMTVNTSRRLKMDNKIPEAQVSNPDIVDLTPLSPNEVQVSAKNPGVTQINLYDADDKIYTIDVIVHRDVAELSMLLESQFPQASLKVIPVGNGVMITGYVHQASDVSLITAVAEEYYPKVIPAMTVAGVQQVLLHVRVMEVSRTKLRKLGFDFAKLTGNNLVVSGVSGLISGIDEGTVTTSGQETFAFSVVDGTSAFFGVLEALRQDHLMKVLAEPTLVTVSGRPAFFQVGGEFPILEPQSLGTVTYAFKKFGTQVDFVPIVLGNGRIRLEVRPRVSEIDNTRSVTINSTTIPGLRTREVDTGVEMTAGQTLAIAGLVQTRIEAENKGLPWVSEVPYLGMLFRRVQHRENEIELLILVTPELVEAMDPSEVPACPPGTRTTTPSDWDLFAKGHMEVPKCCPDYGQCAASMESVGGEEIIGGLGDSMPIESFGEPTPAADPHQPPTDPMPAPEADPLPSGSRPAGPTDLRTASRPRAAYPQPAFGARPAAAHNPTHRYNQAAPRGHAASGQHKTANSEPGFIGPIGYDELD
jgi:pilus assembly protein CpaC